LIPRLRTKAHFLTLQLGEHDRALRCLVLNLRDHDYAVRCCEVGGGGDPKARQALFSALLRIYVQGIDDGYGAIGSIRSPLHREHPKPEWQDLARWIPSPFGT
jgi:hypothetical protein